MNSLKIVEWALWGKNLAIFLLVVALLTYLHRGKKAPGHITDFAKASTFFFVVASGLLWFTPSGFKWASYLFWTDSWTLWGDAAILFLSLSYGYAIVIVMRLAGAQ